MTKNVSFNIKPEKLLYKSKYIVCLSQPNARIKKRRDVRHYTGDSDWPSWHCNFCPLTGAPHALHKNHAPWAYGQTIAKWTPSIFWALPSLSRHVRIQNGTKDRAPCSTVELLNYLMPVLGTCSAVTAVLWRPLYCFSTTRWLRSRVSILGHLPFPSPFVKLLVSFWSAELWRRKEVMP